MLFSRTMWSPCDSRNHAMVDDDNSDPTTATLRPFQLSDVDAVASWSADAAVSRFLSHGPLSSRDEAVSYLSYKIHYYPWYRAICFRGRVVGAISLTPADGPVSRHAARGRGIATTAVRMAMAAAFEEWPEVERVEGWRMSRIWRRRKCWRRRGCSEGRCAQKVLCSEVQL